MLIKGLILLGGKNVNNARPKAVVNAVQGNNVHAVKASACWVWKPKHKVLDRFWSIAKAKTINGEVQIHDKVDGKKIIVTESSVRRDLQLADEEDQQLEEVSTHKSKFSAPSHSKKIFGNMRRTGKGFSGRVTPLFLTMVVQNQAEMGEGSAMPTDPQHAPNEAVYKVLDDRLVRAATTASSLKAEQDNEKTKTTQVNVIDSLKKRVKKLGKRNRSRTHKLKRLYKVGLTARVESSDNKESLGEDASKQERRIDDIVADEDITMVNVHADADKDLGCKEVFVEQEVVADKEKINEVTLAQALAEL
nr:hypothetical protein [Tanacetum cinerariifolium]